MKKNKAFGLLLLLLIVLGAYQTIAQESDMQNINPDSTEVEALFRTEPFLNLEQAKHWETRQLPT